MAELSCEKSNSFNKRTVVFYQRGIKGNVFNLLLNFMNIQSYVISDRRSCQSLRSTHFLPFRPELICFIPMAERGQWLLLLLFHLSPPLFSWNGKLRRTKGKKEDRGSVMRNGTFSCPKFFSPFVREESHAEL